MSSRPRVTITLGRSGQVVKRNPVADVSASDTALSPGGKRPIRERLGSNMDDSNFYGTQYMSKRRRIEKHGSSLSEEDLYGDGQYSNSRRIGQDDLRLKLMRKSLSQRNNAGAVKQNGLDLREKLTRSTRDSSRYATREYLSKTRASGLLKQIPPARSADDLLQLVSVKKSYPSVDGLRHRPPDRLAGVSRAMSPPRSYDDLPLPPVRSLGALRASSQIRRDLVSTSRPAPYMSKPALPVNATRPDVGAPPPGNTVQKNTFMSEPQTVAGLLQSLGLTKYAVIFQAEEVDMHALRQMGDSDLKEMGIPMGPRKKILLAVMPYSKQRHR